MHWQTIPIDNSNIHRGYPYFGGQGHDITNRQDQYTEFINAHEDGEIIFTKGTTESINLVAAAFGRKYITRAMKS